MSSFLAAGISKDPPSRQGLQNEHRGMSERVLCQAVGEGLAPREAVARRRKWPSSTKLDPAAL